jgi:hypothetical protein
LAHLLALCLTHFYCIPVPRSHANRPEPLSNNPKESLIYTVVEIGHRIANNRAASWVVVTSDPQQEHDAWTRAGGRDSLTPVRVPPFTEAEAHALLARHICGHANPKAVPPSAEQLQGIANEHASTFKFICGSVGTRARWLLRLLQVKPLTDAELTDDSVAKRVTVDSAFVDRVPPTQLRSGVPLDPAYYPFLSKDLHVIGLHVDPAAWAEFTNLVTERKESLKPLLEVPRDFWLPPHPSAKPTAEDEAKRVLATDLALRDLLNVAAGEGATVKAATTSTPGVPAGVSLGITWEALRDKYFGGHPADLRALCAAHVLFYNHGTRTVEFESELMRRVVQDWLSEPRHLARIELLRKLQEWQKASAVKAEAKELLALHSQATSFTDWSSWITLAAARHDLGIAVKRVQDLEESISAVREKLQS